MTYPNRSDNSAWYPEPEEARVPVRPEDASTWWEPLEDRDYGERYGHVGDFRAPSPMRRIASLIIDAALCAYLPFMILSELRFGNEAITFVVFMLATWNAAFYRPSYGQTIGKQLLGIQAVRTIRTREGKQAIVRRGTLFSLIRAYLHVLDVAFWFVSIPLIIAGRRHRSIGDILTKTMLIHLDVPVPLAEAPRHAVTLT